LIILIILPLRAPSFSMTTPRKFSGQSTDQVLDGLLQLVVMVRVRISGLPTASSKPSRRIISMRMRAAVRRDHDLEVSWASSSTLMETLVSKFFIEAVAQVARGDPLAFAAGEGRGVDREGHGDRGLVDLDGRERVGISALVTVSPMVMPSTPAMARMSPCAPMVSSMRFRPSKEYILVILVVCMEPSSLAMLTMSP